MKEEGELGEEKHSENRSWLSVLRDVRVRGEEGQKWRGLHGIYVSVRVWPRLRV